MARIVHALIEHRLTPSDILKLPEILNKHTSPLIAGEWEWTSHDEMDETFLMDLWAKNEEDFMNNSFSIEDLALLQKDKLTIDFASPNLITFDNLMPWDAYNNSETLRAEFNELVKIVAQIVSSVDLIILPDLSSISYFDERTDLSVDALRQKAKNHAQPLLIEL